MTFRRVLLSVVALASGLAGSVHAQADGASTPVTQQAYLKASNTGAVDGFARSVAISGDTLVVGAPHEDSSASGVDGDQADDSVNGAGAVYVFVRNGPSWRQQAYLKAPNPETFDLFGGAVAISGDTLVVGAWGEDSSATGVDGDQADNGANGSGAAYVFVRRAGLWSQQAYLKASNTEEDDGFGVSVSISGDTIVVGAGDEDSSSAGVNGDQADNGAPRAGAAYVFVRDGKTWSQQAYLKASHPQGDFPPDFVLDLGSRFGDSVSVSCDTIAVGASLENNDDGDSGAAYVFMRSGTTWSQQARLGASNADPFDTFGGSVSISGDTVVVGASREDSGATGVDGDQGNVLFNSGAAYVFVREGTSWNEQAYLKASNTGEQDLFGDSVSVSGDTAVIGAFVEASAATGVDGDQGDDSAAVAGAAYVFVRSGSTWSHQAYLKASNTDANDAFGRTLSVSDETLVAGADSEDSAASGVDGDEDDNTATGAGAAYVFDLAGITIDPWTDLGQALAGTGGEPLLHAAGPLTADSALTLELSQALANAPAFLTYGFQAANFAPFYGGTLVPDVTPPGGLAALFTDGAGAFSLHATWPPAVPSGLELYLQWWIDDPGGPFGFAASNAVVGTTP